jgi:hypothetical protein
MGGESKTHEFRSVPNVTRKSVDGVYILAIGISPFTLPQVCENKGVVKNSF